MRRMPITRLNMRCLTPFLLVLLVVLAAAQPHSLEPSWTATLDDRRPILLGAWSPASTCVAAATESAVHVIDAKGTLLWAWKFREESDLRRPGPLALSSSCDAVALGGD